MTFSFSYVQMQRRLVMIFAIDNIVHEAIELSQQKQYLAYGVYPHSGKVVTNLLWYRYKVYP